jgi:Rps23 Pro-64 3,4-dihydroxylase Tpa1-like proline 4-hydroxylase
MAPTRTRSVSPSPTTEPTTKKPRTDSDAPDSEGVTSSFAPDLFHPDTIHKFKTEYTESEPYKHAVVGQLFDDDLLKSVKDEILAQISFTQKETDIYKVNQTGDLASLSYLDASQLALFPSLLKLRDALYSTSFRTWLREVTGCGPLSGSKQDMSVNSYVQTCHLLNHDDVIGTRRVSYILYMPLPYEEPWKPEWGGALELYPTVEVESSNGGLISEPTCIPSKIIPPSWNQFVFFEVQPGKSFHSVEEVVVGTGQDGRSRLSISGWFHKPQDGEEGYEVEMEEAPKSSLEQLSSTSSITFDAYPDDSPIPLPDTPLSEEQLSYLSDYLNPAYLVPKNLKALISKFADESSVELHSFLAEPIATRLEALLREQDGKDGVGEKRENPIPPHTSGTSLEGWKLIGPPHKARYLSLLPSYNVTTTESDQHSLQSPYQPNATTTDILHTLRTTLFASEAFRAWLALVSSLLPLGYAVEVRRFRPGLDYTLATSEAKEARLDVVLDLTPDMTTSPEKVGNGKGKESEQEGEEDTWESGKWGGWQCYMAPPEGDDDPAVYKSSSSKKQNVPENASGEDEEMDEEEEESGPLLTSQPGFNRLLLVLRDEGVLHFVKYISALAKGSRWDIYGEWQVAAVEAEEDGEGVDENVDEDV